MNSRILNKAVLRSLRQGHCRYLSVQQNINKCSGTCHSVNFHRRKENRSSSFIFSNDRTLCQSTLPIHTCFHRNLSGTSQLSQAVSVEQLKKAADVAPTASAEQLQKAADVAAPASTAQKAVDVASPASVEPLKTAADVAPPTGELTQNINTSWLSPEITENFLIEYVQQLLVQMHEATGLPWWASIGLTAMFLRATVTLPFAVTQMRALASFEKVSLSMEIVNRKLKKETVKAQKEYGWPENLADQKYNEAKRKAWWDLVKKENCHPAKAYLLVSIQVALFSTATVATSSLCDPNIIGPKIYTELTSGGFGWITDLTLIDPYLIMPISISLLNLLLVEVHQAFKVDRTSSMEQWKCAFFRATGAAVMPLAAYLPAAVNIYWLSSSFYGLLQAFLLNSSPIRRLFKVPMNDPELEHPYRYFRKNMKEKLKMGRKPTALATK